MSKRIIGILFLLAVLLNLWWPVLYLHSLIFFYFHAVPFIFFPLSGDSIQITINIVAITALLVGIVLSISAWIQHAKAQC